MHRIAQHYLGWPILIWNQMPKVARMLEGTVLRRHPTKANLEVFASEIRRFSKEVRWIIGRHKQEAHCEGIVQLLLNLDEQTDA